MCTRSAKILSVSFAQISLLKRPLLVLTFLSFRCYSLKLFRCDRPEDEFPSWNRIEILCKHFFLPLSLSIYASFLVANSTGAHFLSMRFRISPGSVTSSSSTLIIVNGTSFFCVEFLNLLPPIVQNNWVLQVPLDVFVFKPCSCRRSESHQLPLDFTLSAVCSFTCPLRSL